MAKPEVRDTSQRIQYWMRLPETPQRLHDYFQEGHSSNLYAGRLFEQIGGGGDRTDRANVIDAHDLVAVQMLSVTIPPRVSAGLLQGSLGSELTALLADIPTNVPLADDRARRHIVDDSPADRAWNLLRGNRKTGMGRAKISKLLARKRPRLLPVYDSVVACAVGEPSNWWTALHAFLTDDLLAARETIERLREHGDVPDRVSDLRVVDVAIWMGHEAQHAAKQCEFPPLSADV